jgi:hypothetical protein
LHFLDYLTVDDVTDIITAGVAAPQVKTQVDAIGDKIGALSRQHFQQRQRIETETQRLAGLRAEAEGAVPPKAGPSLLGGAAAKGASPLAAQAGRIRLLDPATVQEAAGRAAGALDQQIDAMKSVLAGQDAAMTKLQAELREVRAGGIDHKLFAPQRGRNRNDMRPRVILHWPLLVAAMQGGAAPAHAMANDARLVANALGTLAAEVGVLFAPVREEPSDPSRGKSLRPFGHYDEPRNYKTGQRPFLGNTPYVPHYDPQSSLSMDDQFALQSVTSDGAQFRGRGWVQTTGRDNYVEAVRRLGPTFAELDLIAEPDLINDARFSYAIFASWMKALEPTFLALLKRDELVRARAIINGNIDTPEEKLHGVAQFIGAYRRCMDVFYAKVQAGTMDAADAKRFQVQATEAAFGFTGMAGQLGLGTTP